MSKTLRLYGPADIDLIPQLMSFGQEQRLQMKAVAAVFPFRTNSYVIGELIDWSNPWSDPIFRMTFPHPQMLSPDDLHRMCDLIRSGASSVVMRQAGHAIQMKMRPHPSGQMDANVPRHEQKVIPGIQHKYEHTVLFFPAEGQTCHAYCTYCFRWPQFIGVPHLKIQNRDTACLTEYLRAHPAVTSVLITGGDPLVMSAATLRRHLIPLLSPELDHVSSIRLGTKALAYWPQRFTSDADSDDLMNLFAEVRAAGRHLTLMAHFSHPREMKSSRAVEAMRRLQAAGIVVRCQAPVIADINDRADLWAEMWRLQVRLSAIPYYMFVKRDTGPRNCFAVPLARALAVFQEAYRSVSGLERTVRGPILSATAGKFTIDGVTDYAGTRAFVLRLLQARDPEWVGQPLFARYDEQATWINQLQPLRAETAFLFNDPDYDQEMTSN